MPARQCKILDQEIIASGFLDSFDYVLVDCDGVLWMGNDAIPGSPETIRVLHEKGKKIIYVTNNSSNDREAYMQKCQRLGFPVDKDSFFTTSYCAAVYLQSLNFKKKVYIFGGRGIANELDLAGIRHLSIGPDPLPGDWIKYVNELVLDPEVGAVIVGFDEHASHPKMIKVISYLKDPECLFIASNKDEQFPTDRNLVIPGTGAYVAAIETGSGRQATVLGKPNKFMIDCIKHKFPDMDFKRCIMIGDRLNTDILLGTQHGLQTLLVLTGISHLEEVREHEKSTRMEDQLLVPDYYLPCLGDLLKLMQS